MPKWLLVASQELKLFWRLPTHGDRPHLPDELGYPDMSTRRRAEGARRPLRTMTNSP